MKNILKNEQDKQNVIQLIATVCTFMIDGKQNLWIKICQKKTGLSILNKIE